MTQKLRSKLQTNNIAVENKLPINSYQTPLKQIYPDASLSKEPRVSDILCISHEDTQEYQTPYLFKETPANVKLNTNERINPFITHLITTKEMPKERSDKNQLNITSNYKDSGVQCDFLLEGIVGHDEEELIEHQNDVISNLNEDLNKVKV